MFALTRCFGSAETFLASDFLYNPHEVTKRIKKTLKIRLFKKSVYLFFLDILSLIIFFKLFKNLNKIKAQKLLKFISKIIFLNDIEDMLKKYALIYMYDKN